MCTAHGRVDRRRHPLPVALVGGALSPSRIAADPHPGACLLRGGDHPHDLRQQRGVDSVGHPPRNRRAVHVLARVPQKRRVEWAQHCSALGATTFRVVLLSSFPVGGFRRRAHRRADLTALEQIDVSPMSDELTPVPPDVSEERVDVRRRGEEDRVQERDGSVLVEPAPGSGGIAQRDNRTPQQQVSGQVLPDHREMGFSDRERERARGVVGVGPGTEHQLQLTVLADHVRDPAARARENDVSHGLSLPHRAGRASPARTDLTGRPRACLTVPGVCWGLSVPSCVLICGGVGGPPRQRAAGRQFVRGSARNG